MVFLVSSAHHDNHRLLSKNSVLTEQSIVADILPMSLYANGAQA